MAFADSYPLACSGRAASAITRAVANRLNRTLSILFDPRGRRARTSEVENIASNVSAFKPNLEMSDKMVLDRASHFVSSV